MTWDLRERRTNISARESRSWGACPQGFLKHTIEEAGGHTVAPDDVVGIKQAIAAYFEQFERHTLKGPKPDVIEKYNRVSLTGSLVKIFESLMVT